MDAWLQKATEKVARERMLGMLSTRTPRNKGRVAWRMGANYNPIVSS